MRQFKDSVKTGKLCCLVAFFILVSLARAEAVTIRILYVNDFHGFAEPYKPLGSKNLLGGVTYLAAKIDELRREKPSLLISAGDMIQGNIWTNLFQGEPVIELMNAMKFDAMVVGNHEFDFGQRVLRQIVSEAKFSVLGANVQGIEALQPYVIKEIEGVKVAVIGVVTEDTPETTHPGNVAGLKFLSPADTVRKYLSELDGRADIILVLSHIGFADDRILAEQVKGINVIVGGHSHTKIEKPVQVGETIIVQAWEHGKALGVLDLTIEKAKITKFEGHLQEIRPRPDDGDPAVRAIVERYGRRVGSLLNEVVGQSDIDLDGENVRKKETNLGDVIADIIREKAGADAAMINGGDIRTSIRNGDIRVKDIYSVLPFDDYIVAVKLTGRQIVQALEHGVSAVDQGSGRFPQVSGITFTYSPSAIPGSRVKETYIGGKKLDPEKEYVVATNDFLAAGGDGYKVFGEAIGASGDTAATEGISKGGKVVYSDPGKWLKDVVVEYIREKATINPKVEGRIKEAQ